MPGSPLTHATSWRGAEAGLAYERGRPDYPEAAVAALAQQLRLGPAATVADLAAGTGKLTRMLIPTGARVIAVEPAPGMLAQLSEAVPEALTVAGNAEHLPLATGAVDAMTVAQAMHWFRATQAIAEFHRALRPAGRLAVVYNDRDERIPWVAQLSGILNRYEQLAPRPREGPGWRQAFGADDRFGPFDQLEFDHSQVLNQDGFRDRIRSMSFVILLNDTEQARLEAELDALVAGQDPIVMPMRTRVLISERVP